MELLSMKSIVAGKIRSLIISFTAEEDIVGSFYIDITGATPAYVAKSGSVSNVATLKANGETTYATAWKSGFPPSSGSPSSIPENVIKYQFHERRKRNTPS